jgi:hypothetical protein
MSSELNQSQRKKPYEPPRLVAISLRPEEAVLGHCKVSGTTGSVQSSCSAIGPCVTIGS